MKMLKFAIVLFVVTFYTGVSAQSYKLNLDCFNEGESVLLRWYPETIDDYRRGALGGFVVQRRIVSRTGEGDWKELARIEASSFDDFSKLMEEEDDRGLIGFALYQKEFTEKTKKLIDEGVIMPDSMNIESYDSPLAQLYIYKMALLSCEFDWGESKMAALCFKDETVDWTMTYDYRVVFADGKDADKSKVLRVDMMQKSNLSAPENFKGEAEDENIIFSWDVSKMKESYSGYVIERSEDGKNFEVVNEKPIIHMYADEGFENTCVSKDTFPLCDKDFYYRVRGVSHFDKVGPPSKVVKLRCVSDYVVTVKIDTVSINEKNEAEIRWHVENPYNQEIIGFLVQRAEKFRLDSITRNPSFDVLNKKLLSPKTFVYKDEKSLLTNYYRVLALGKNTSQIAVSNVVFAHQIDSVPPAPPVGLRGVVDSVGVVTLEWDANKEPDIMAYRVFFSNSGKEEFVSCSDSFLKVPLFKDTLYLGALTNEIYYKVAALDENYNQSALSEAVMLEKPDTISPAKAVFLDVKQDSVMNMMVNWVNSSSVDLAKVELYRNLNEGVGEWSLLASWNDFPEVKSYIDTFRFKGERICYKLVSYDKSGNNTTTQSIPVKTKAVKLECLKDVRYSVDYQKERVKVEWSQCGCDVSKIYVFRVADGHTKLVDTVLGSERVYFDTEVKKGVKYQYKVLPVTKKQARMIETGEFVY